MSVTSLQTESLHGVFHGYIDHGFFLFHDILCDHLIPLDHVICLGDFFVHDEILAPLDEVRDSLGHEEVCQQSEHRCMKKESKDAGRCRIIPVGDHPKEQCVGDPVGDGICDHHEEKC